MDDLGESDFEGFKADWDNLLNGRDYIYFLIEDNVEWDSQLRAISLLLDRNRKAREEFSEYIRRDEEEVRAYTGPHHDHYAGQHVDLLYETVYRDAAESMAAIGMIAPMVESILSQALAALGRMYQEKNMIPPTHERWTRADKGKRKWEERWNCQLYFNRKGEAASNIPLGFPQLADACGLAPYLSEEFMRWFEAMFNYRNYMFHGGFEWTVHSREKFTEMIEAKGWERFFTCSTSGDKPWIYYLTNETIADMPAMVGKMLDDLGRFAKDLPFELISKP